MSHKKERGFRRFQLPPVSKSTMRRFKQQLERERIEYEAHVRWLGGRVKRFHRLTPLEQYEVAAHLVGDFTGGDGYAYLVYADSAGHEMAENTCKLVGRGNHSCHLHIGIMGTGYAHFLPKTRRWTHGRCFCAQGATRDEAIIRALKLAGLRR